MSEQNTIPTQMLDAAAKAVIDSAAGFYLIDNGCKEVARAALEAAGVPELATRIAELEAALALAIPRMEHLQSLLSCGESVQFCNEFDEQKSKDVAEEVERLKRIIQNAPTGAGGE